jgi:DNA polymerase III alpha subunit
MNVDKFGNPIFNEQDLFDILYKGQTDFLSELTVEPSTEISNLETISEITFKKYNNDLDSISIADYDQALQSDWFMPDEYKTLDIEKWLFEQAPPWDPEATRLQEELAEFKARNMIDLLRWLKYFVDTCTKEQVLWGLGRGSSVASYVLYLIGVHSIDPIKYNLDWREFLR